MAMHVEGREGGVGGSRGPGMGGATSSQETPGRLPHESQP